MWNGTTKLDFSCKIGSLFYFFFVGPLFLASFTRSTLKEEKYDWACFQDEAYLNNFLKTRLISRCTEMTKIIFSSSNVFNKFEHQPQSLDGAACFEGLRLKNSSLDKLIFSQSCQIQSCIQRIFLEEQPDSKSRPKNFFLKQTPSSPSS